MVKTVLAMTSINPNGTQALEQYLDVVGRLMEHAGARLVQRYEVAENLAGKEFPQFVSIVEYPDDAAIDMVFGSPEYITLKPVRDVAFSKYDICVVA